MPVNLFTFSLENFAGWANKEDGQGKRGYWPGGGAGPYGDRGDDNSWITMGIEYAKQYPVQNGPGPCN
jgi:hypothetical protein